MARAVFPSGRKSLLLLALAAAIIGGAWWWQRPPPEPVYQGQRLSELFVGQEFSEWIADSMEHDVVRSEYAVELRAFGPATVPWLAYTAEYGRHPFKRHGPLPFDNAPQWLRKWVPEKWGGLPASSQINERICALATLGALGPEAVPAIKTVAKVLEHESEGGNLDVAYYAAVALHTMGPASWPVVEQLLQHGTPQARHALLATIYFRLGPVEKPAGQAEVAKVVTILVKACRDQDASVRRGAVDSIRNSQDVRSDLIALDPFLNELFNLLSDSDPDVRREAVQGLAFYGTKAAQAIPRLIELLDDRDVYIRGTAAATLAHVDMVEKRSAPRLRIMSRDDPDGSYRSVATHALKALGLSADDKSAVPEALPGQ